MTTTKNADSEIKMNRNIVLVGLMGCGKSSVGKALAEKTGLELVDTDELIEQQKNKTINEIFKINGEKYFRELEHQCATALSNKAGLIISTGGGMVENTENMDLLKQNGYVFYLYAPAEELYKRVKNETHRPLLKNPDPLETLSNLLERRVRSYEKAHFKINTVNKQVSEIADEIVKLRNK